MSCGNRQEQRQTVLVVDDERVHLAVLSELLKGEYRVLLAKNGQQALDRVAQEQEIDLILLDVMMPELDGHEVLRRLKRNDKTKDIPVIFITALNTVGDEESGLRLGACDYIGKPFSPAIVKARVANILGFVRQRKMLEVLAGRDGLTEIANRRRFDETLEREWGRNQRNARPFSLVMLDIDDFKQYNDRYGHASGDAALKMVARVLTRSLRRPSDFAARYGGEEFVLILPDTDVAGGREIAEKVRDGVEQLAIPHEASVAAPHVTVSIGGVTVCGGNDAAMSIVEAADAMLYEAKHRGRNRIVWKPD